MIKRDNRTIITIPDELWDQIKVILPREKPLRTVGRPIVDSERCLMEFYTSSELGANGRCYPKSMDRVPHAIEGFRNGNKVDVFKKTWVRLLKIYDQIIGINWTWQSIDSISIKSPLGGR